MNAVQMNAAPTTKKTVEVRNERAVVMERQWCVGRHAGHCPKVIYPV
jgi:hypothetical protein